MIKENRITKNNTKLLKNLRTEIINAIKNEYGYLPIDRYFKINIPYDDGYTAYITLVVETFVYHDDLKFTKICITTKTGKRYVYEIENDILLEYNEGNNEVYSQYYDILKFYDSSAIYGPYSMLESEFIYKALDYALKWLMNKNNGGIK